MKNILTLLNKNSSNNVYFNISQFLAIFGAVVLCIMVFLNAY